MSTDDIQSIYVEGFGAILSRQDQDTTPVPSTRHARRLRMKHRSHKQSDHDDFETPREILPAKGGPPERIKEDRSGEDRKQGDERRGGAMTEKISTGVDQASPSLTRLVATGETILSNVEFADSLGSSFHRRPRSGRLAGSLPRGSSWSVDRQREISRWLEPMVSGELTVASAHRSKVHPTTSPLQLLVAAVTTTSWIMLQLLLLPLLLLLLLLLILLVLLLVLLLPILLLYYCY